MDKIIKKILEIDKKAVDIKKNTEEMGQMNEMKLKKILNRIEKQGMERAKERANKRYDKLINEAQKIVDEKRIESEDEQKKLENIFSEKQSELSLKIFNKIINE